MHGLYIYIYTEELGSGKGEFEKIWEKISMLELVQCIRFCKSDNQGLRQTQQALVSVSCHNYMQN